MNNFILFIFISYSLITNAETLIITDSHGEGSFGSELIKLIEQSNENVSLYAVGGSNPKDWLLGLKQRWGYFEYHTGQDAIRTSKPTTPKFTNLFQKHRPQKVIIELGTNLIWQVIEKTKLKNDIISLIQEVHLNNAKCFWIGAPDLDPRSEIYEARLIDIQKILQETVTKEKCQLIPSWEFTLYPKMQGDGIHYDTIPLIGSDLARKWAKDALIQF